MMVWWENASGVYARLASGELIGPYGSYAELEADTTESERAHVVRGDGWGE